MSRSAIIVYCIVVALVMLFVYPVQLKSIDEQSNNSPVRDKRWTFNTWRLHGRRQALNNLDSRNPLTSTSDDDQSEGLFHTEDDIAHAIHERLSNFFRGYSRQ